MDVQTLIGNISGYIGLCLGYSLLQIPGFILLVFQKVQKCLILNKSKENTGTNCIEQTPEENNDKSGYREVTIQIEKGLET